MTEVLYQQIREDLRERIVQGKYPLDSKLPSETKLQNYYQVSRVTLRNAISGLVDEGFIEKVQGKGSFVRKPEKVNRLIRKSSVESFSTVARLNGFNPSLEVLKIDQRQAPKKFEYESKGETMLYIERLCKVDDVPILWEQNYYPLPRFTKLQEFDLTNSIYQILNAHFKIQKLHSDNTTLSMYLCDLKASRILHKNLGFPLFKLETVVCDEKSNIVHLGEQYIVSDRYQFKL